VFVLSAALIFHVFFQDGALCIFIFKMSCRHLMLVIAAQFDIPYFF
jgi:hypothetical protein